MDNNRITPYSPAVEPFVELHNTTQWRDMGTPAVRVTGEIVYWVRDTGTFETVPSGSDRAWDIYLENLDRWANIDCRYPDPLDNDGMAMGDIDSRVLYSQNS